MLSINSLMLRTETMPPWRNAASTTSAAPASEPEWVAAARFDTSERPPLRMISGLLRCGGFARDREQAFRLFEAFDEHGDDAGVGVFDEVVDVLFDGRAGLIAAGNDVAQADMAVEHERVGDRRAESAALRDQRHRAGEKSRRDRRGEQRRFAVDVQARRSSWGRR